MGFLNSKSFSVATLNPSVKKASFKLSSALFEFLRIRKPASFEKFPFKPLYDLACLKPFFSSNSSPSSTKKPF